MADNADCKDGWNLVCCVKDQRGQLVDPTNCRVGDVRYRAYACEKPSSTVKSCSDVCWVTNGIKGQCLENCPTGVGPILAGYPLQECCGAGCIIGSSPGTGTIPSTPITVPTGPLTPWIPGTPFSDWIKQNIAALLSAFNSASGGIALGSTPTPMPTFSPQIIPTATPFPNSTCIAPFNTASTFFDPSALNDQINTAYSCGLNELAGHGNNIYVFRECYVPNNSSSNQICYYDCIDQSSTQRTDCQQKTIDILGLYSTKIGTQFNNPKRTLLRIFNNSGVDIELSPASVSQGPIVITRSGPGSDFGLVDPLIISLANTDKIKSGEVLTLDISNLPVACSYKPVIYNKISFTVNYNDGSTNFQETKNYTCEDSFSALIEIN